MLCKSPTVKETCMYTAHEISSKTLFKVGFWGAPPSPLQLGHQHNSSSSVSNRWLERRKLQPHAQQKKSFGGKVDLHPCLPAAGDVSHANTELLPALKGYLYTVCKPYSFPSRRWWPKQIRPLYVRLNPTPPSLTLPPSIYPQTLFLHQLLIFGERKEAVKSMWPSHFNPKNSLKV